LMPWKTPCSSSSSTEAFGNVVSQRTQPKFGCCIELPSELLAGCWCLSTLQRSEIQTL
jgi:hypothetical protein